MSLAAPGLALPLTRPLLDEEESQAVVEVLQSGWLVQGPKVAAFEELVAEYVGARHAVATSSCTTALHLALVLLGIGPGDEVLVPSFTFIATANAVRHAGATPVFVDIDPRTYNVDPRRLEAAISPRTRAVMPVHQLGLAADLDPIAAIARARGLHLIEDAAPALGATYKGTRVGGRGNVTCFSFHPRKAITTGEGGMIVTDDGELAERARMLRAHGMSVSDLARHRATAPTIEQYPQVGYNYRLSDLHAAIGIAQMKKLAFVLERRQEVALRYSQALAEFDFMRLPYSSPETPHTYQSYMIELASEAPATRDRLMHELLGRGVPTRRGVMAVHLEPCYRSVPPAPSLPVTERAAQNSLLLPIYAAMTPAEQDYVIEQVRRVLRER
jgi:perosamine synthetase